MPPSAPPDHATFPGGLPASLRERLTRRSDGAGLRHLAAHAGLAAGLALWIALALPLWPLAIWPLGIALAFLFTLQHECTHRTPFRTGWLNEVVGHVTGAILIQPFHWFRAFHMAHHRHTNLPGRDPELDAPKPETWSELAWHLGGLGYWRSKVEVLVANASGRARGAYLGVRSRPLVRREARVHLAVYAGLLVVSLLWLGPLLFWIWLLPLATGFPVLRLYLLAEHGRCPQVADMFRNTRTTYTARLVRFLAWNMPYHTEHHVWPTVPFHKLPEVNGLMRAQLRVTSPSYRAFTADYLRGLEG